MEKQESIIGVLGKSVLDASLSCIPFVGELISSAAPELYQKSKQKHFEEFLLGLSFESEKMTDEKKQEIEKKLTDSEAYPYLSSIIDSMFFSKSKKARIMLGVICAQYLKDNLVNYADLVIIEALKVFIDDELDTFNEIYFGAIGPGAEETNGKGAFYYPYYPERIIQNITFGKLQKYNIIGNHAESLYSKSPNSWHGEVTPITNLFKYYLDAATTIMKKSEQE